MGLDVRPEAVAGQRLRHGAQVGFEPRPVDEEGRRRELRRLHAGRLPTGCRRGGGRSGTLRVVSTPWLGDACGLVDAFRAKDLSPLEALDACIAAIEASPLNAFSHTDFDRARAGGGGRQRLAALRRGPLGRQGARAGRGLALHRSLDDLRRPRLGARRHLADAGLRTAGAVLAAQTTASEFGGINCTSTELHGTTRNPWNLERTPGGSSGGTAAAVAGGLLPIATGSDGGGSIRIPAGFCGLFGLKATYGRIPKGPPAGIEPLTHRPRLPDPVGPRHGALLRLLQRVRPA